MTDDLFPEVKDCESPRLKWFKQFDMHTKCDRAHDLRWMAWSGDSREAAEYGLIGFGDTEMDALANWCELVGERLWNEKEGW